MFSPVYNEQFFVAKHGPIDPEGASSGRKPRCSKHLACERLSRRPSLDWFSGEKLRRKPWFLPWNMKKIQLKTGKHRYHSGFPWFLPFTMNFHRKHPIWNMVNTPTGFPVQIFRRTPIQEVHQCGIIHHQSCYPLVNVYIAIENHHFL